MRNLLWTNSNPKPETICGTCAELIGTVFHEDNHPICPVHPGCYCFLIPTDMDITNECEASGLMDASGYSPDSQETWSKYVAYLLRKGYEVPAFYNNLVPIAEELNKQRAAFATQVMPQKGDAMPESITIEEITPLETTPDQVALGETAPLETSPLETAPDQITPEEIALAETAPQEITPGETTPDQIIPGEITESRVSMAASIRPSANGFEVVLINPGEANGLFFSADVLAQSVERFNNLTSFTNHEQLSVYYDRPGGRTIDDICGVVHTPRWTGSEIIAQWTPSLPKGDFVAAMIDQIIKDRDAGLPVPDVGVSLDLAVYYDQQGVVTTIPNAFSADIVFNAARGPHYGEAFARIRNAVESQSAFHHVSPPFTGGTSMPDTIITPETITPAVSTTDVADRMWADAMRTSAISSLLATSGLPDASRQRLATGTYNTPVDLQAAIDAERKYLATLTEQGVINIGGVAPRTPNISMGRNSIEQVEHALLALLAGTSPSDGVAPLSGIRELYHILSGDYEMTGLYQADRVMLANVTSSTMAGLVANALNKVLVKAFQEYPQWWAPFVTIQDFTSLQDIRWITLGGLGELPTVSEGAAYTELTWDDQTETASFLKKGGYLGITLETIDKDDTFKLRVAPQALAQSAWLTLSKAIATIFSGTSGTGPLMSDSTRLFTTGHLNLGTSPLSYTSVAATRIAMRQQTELNSGERLGALTAPKYFLVPSDLETMMLQILMSTGEVDTSENQENPFADGSDRQARLASARDRTVVVDFWTDTNNWAAVADPKLYPTIGLGFRYGRQPEIFSVASPTAGLMFSNDVMPIKVRYFYATGPMDWRGLYKHNVS